MDQCTHEVRLQYWKTSSHSARQDPKASLPNSGWLTMASVNKLIIYGNVRSANLHMN